MNVNIEKISYICFSGAFESAANFTLVHLSQNGEPPFGESFFHARIDKTVAVRIQVKTCTEVEFSNIYKREGPRIL